MVYPLRWLPAGFLEFYHSLFCLSLVAQYGNGQTHLDCSLLSLNVLTYFRFSIFATENFFVVTVTVVSG